MLRILHGTKIDFVKPWRIAVGITIAFILLGFVIIAALGPGTTQVAYAIALAVVPTLGRVARSLNARALGMVV